MKLRRLPRRLVLEGGTILDPVQKVSRKGDVLLENGKIAALGKISSPRGVHRLDCSDLVVTHGFCDLHVHFREPGREDKETLASGSRAALAGGFTRVCAMPNTDPPLDSPEAIRFLVEQAQPCPVHIHPIGALTMGQRGKTITEMSAMRDAGAVAFSDDGHPVSRGAVLRRALEYTAMLEVPVINHAEDESLRDGGLMNEGSVSTRLGLPGNPAAAEATMVYRDLELCLLTQSSLHVPHVSTARAVEHIRRVKRHTSLVSAEVTPHHLFFDDQALTSFDTNLKVAPPIRSAADRKALIGAVLDDTLDCIATDHAPHTIEEKEATFDQAPFGMIGLESCFGAVHQVLVVESGLSLEDLVRKLTVNPRRIMGFDADLFQTGQPAEITVLDPGVKWIFSRGDIHSRSINSPFLGRELTGRPVYTIARGFLAQFGA